jgi:magnesium transporter
MSERAPILPRERSSPAPAPAGEGEVRIRLSRPGASHCLEIPAEEISEVLPTPGAVLWMDVRDPGSAILDTLREEFHFHRLALEDVAKQRQRPKVDEYPEYYFVVMYALAPEEAGGGIETAEVDLFVGRNYVVSLHRGAIPALHEAMHRWERTEPDLRGQVGFLLHTIIDAVIDAYFPAVDGIEDRLDSLELAMFRPGGSVDTEELLGVKRSLFTLRKAIYPLREVFNAFLRRDQAIFTPDTFPYFQDVYDHVLRLLDIIDIQRDMATGALDAHLAVISNRLNETMKRLTVVGICVAIMGAVFGAWGMNFDSGVPLAHLKNGFWIVSAGVLVLVALTLVWTRWRRLW